MNEIALNIANDLRKLADSIESLTKKEQKPHVATVEELREPATPQKYNLPTLEEVRAKLASLSKAGKQAQVRELITGFRGHKGTVLLCYSPKEYSIIILGVMIWRDKLERKARQVFTM